MWSPVYGGRCSPVYGGRSSNIYVGSRPNPAIVVTSSRHRGKALTVQITFIFIDFRVCDFAFAFKTQNAPCVSRFKRVLFSDRFQFAF